VTVAHSNTAEADAWATALMVLGEKEGFKLAQQENIAAFFVYRDRDSFSTRYTEAFQQYLEPPNVISQ